MIRFIILVLLSMYIFYAAIRLFNYFFKNDEENFNRKKRYDKIEIDPSKIIDADFEEIKEENKNKK